MAAPSPPLVPQHNGNTTVGDGLHVTPSDTIPVSGDTGTLAPCRALYIGTSGNLTVKWASGRTQTFKNFPVGFFPGNVVYVMATGTTATDIEACW